MDSSVNVSEYIMNAIQKRYSINEDIDMNSFNYVESGYIDSLGIIQFIAEVEDDFDIEFTDEEIASPSFKIAGDLIKLIERKVSVK